MDSRDVPADQGGREPFAFETFLERAAVDDPQPAPAPERDQAALL